MKFSLRTALYFLLYLLAFSFCVKAFREPDLWWQLKTGEWIIAHGDVPRSDVFSYTHAGVEWINVKWLFEVLAHVAALLLGTEGVYLLCGLCWLLLVWVLLQTARLLLHDLKLSDTWQAVVAAIGVSVVVYGAAFRINGRPEVFSHLFTAVFIWQLLKFRQQLSHKIWWLVLLQILWANLHEGFATGIAISWLFSAGAAGEYYLKKSAVTPEQLRGLLLLCVAQPLSVVVHPYGLLMLSRPTELFSQIAGNKYTSELLGISSVAFWKTEAYLVVTLLVIIAGGLVLHFFSKRKNTATFPLFAFLPVAAGLLYLSTTAQRNLPFAALGLFPLLVFVLGENLQRIPSRYSERTAKILAIVLCVRLALGYGLVVSNYYYENTQSRDRYGLQISSELNPVGAADFIRKNQLQGKCFSDYLVSAYLLYALKYDFKTYLDLRDLDVFRSSFMDSFFVVAAQPSQFAALHARERFDYVVLYRGEFAPLHNYLHHDTNWRSLYADAVAVVYAPKEKWSSVQPQLFTQETETQCGAPAALLNRVLNPFYQPTSKVSAAAAQAVYSLAVNDPFTALSLAPQNFDSDRQQWFDISGQAWMQVFNTIPSDSLRQVALLNMTDAYHAGVKEFPNNVSLRLGKGAAFFKQGNLQEALQEFEQCAKLDKENLRAYLFTAECYSQLAKRNPNNQEQYLRPALKNYLAAYSLNATDPLVKSNIGFLSFRLKDCATATRFLQMVVNDATLPEADRAKARECIADCR